MSKFKMENKIAYNLIKSIFLGAIVIFAAFYFVYYIGGNPYYEYRLMKEGVTTTGFITDANEDVTDDDQGRANFTYYFSYKFKTSDDKTIFSHGNSDGRLPNELSELSKPYPIKVVYLSAKPEINKIKNTMSPSINEFLWRKIILGILLLLTFSSIGAFIIRNGIKEYLAVRKKAILI